MEDLPQSGIYVLVVHARFPLTIAAGALGSLEFGRGYYAYVGRAERRLKARLARHARAEDKRLRWHIDYLLEQVGLEEIWVFPLCEGECELARRLEAGGASREGLRGFGSSDCRCPGHLLYLGKGRPRPPLQRLGVRTRHVIIKENNLSKPAGIHLLGSDP